jgi:putative ABC transport system ATP-binding protein
MDDDSTTEVRTRGLRKTFLEGGREHVVLDGVDVDVRTGETVAIRGRSGSGKSTFLNLLGGIDTPVSGTVTVAGTELTSLNERERTLFRRRYLGLVFQAFNLVPTLSVGDNIRLVLELNGVARNDASRRIADLLDAVGLADRVDAFPDVLSGGEQQRVAIARALSHRPALLLADEPTGNLDDRTAETVLELLQRLVRDLGGTMLIATHSARVAAYCDRTLTMHDGRLEPDA